MPDNKFRSNYAHHTFHMHKLTKQLFVSMNVLCFSVTLFYFSAVVTSHVQNESSKTVVLLKD